MSKALSVNTGARGKGTAEKAVKEAGKKARKCRASTHLTHLVTWNLESP